MEKPIKGHLTELMVGNRTYHYTTDFEAMEMAESLPQCVRWQVRLQNNKGLVDSEKYHDTRKEYDGSHQDEPNWRDRVLANLAWIGGRRNS